MHNNAGKVSDAYGSAIHVDGKKCNIDGNGSTKFISCETTAKYGGAIYIDDGYRGCRISNCEFIWCKAAKYGGAIYASADDCVITNCTFNECTANGVDSFVYGEEKNQTKLVNCKDNNGNPCNINNCPGCIFDKGTGFTLSGGNLWIVIAGGVVVLGGIAAIIVVSKKKKKA